MRKKILFLIFILSTQINFGQKKKYTVHTISFYNLENLFDTINNPLTNDEASPIMEIKRNRSKIYFKKIKNLQKVILEIGYENTKAPPTLLGVAEIETNSVLHDLINTNQTLKNQYNYIHYDSPDKRGIDVALVYNKEKFIPIHHHSYELKLWSNNGYRIYTRDQLLVSGYLENELTHIIVNHWPSRRGGEKKSRILREKAALLNKKICDSIFSSHPNSKIILMGDLNDNPTNSSLKEVLKTKEISNTPNDTLFYNPYETLYKKGFGTLGYRDNIHLFDQIIINGKFLSKKFKTLNFYQAHIFNPSYLTQQTGKYKGYPFRSFGNGNFTEGYSDHYPVYIYLIKELE